TGQAFVGTVGVEGTDEYDVTVLGDVANVTARLASLARQGEVVASDDAYRAAGIDLGDPDRRTIELRGRTAPLDVRVITVSPVSV
ncbi:MAG: hypothetical protein ABR609_11055, partial [Acidimicrobiia bacterium]